MSFCAGFVIYENLSIFILLCKDSTRPRHCKKISYKSDNEESSLRIIVCYDKSSVDTRNQVLSEDDM